MQYKILNTITKNEIDNAVTRLEKMVNEEMKDGWRPQGGVNINHTELIGCHLYLVAQAMVKED